MTDYQRSARRVRRPIGRYVLLLLIVVSAVWMLFRPAPTDTVKASLTPTVLTPYFVPDPLLLTGKAGGPIRAKKLFGEGYDCGGYVPAEPQHLLTIPRPLESLRLEVTSENDTSLFLLEQAGANIYCNDDTRGIHPRLDLKPMPSGNYYVFIGDLERNQRTPYTLTATEYRSEMSEFAPDDMGTRIVRLRAGFTPDPYRLSFEAGGPRIASREYGHPCNGYIGAEADHIFEVTEVMPKVRFDVETDEDLTLVMVSRETGETYCNDDYNPPMDLEPRLTLTNLTTGTYEVFVGTLNPDEKPLYTLLVTEQVD